MNDTDTIANSAIDRFAQGYNCAQSVLAAFCPKLGLDPDVALRLATGFGAGMARRQQVCGAVTGGIMALGCRYGRAEGQPKSVTGESYVRINRFFDAFAQKRGSCQCRDLLGGCDLKTSEGQARFKSEGLLDTVCKPCVRTAVELVDAQLRGE